MELDVGMALEPAIIFAPPRAQIIADEVAILAWMGGHEAVHEVAELAAPAAVLIGCRGLAGGHFESRKERRGAIALISKSLDLL